MQASDQVYFELDLTNPYTIASLTSCQLLPRGLNLSQVLPPNIYMRLRDHLEWVRLQMQDWITEDQAGRGLYADYLYNAITGNWERKRPVWAMLMVNGLTASDIASRGFPVLDLYLAQLAEQGKKKVGAVERVEEQCLPLNGLSYNQIIFALQQTLQQVLKSSRTFSISRIAARRHPSWPGGAELHYRRLDQQLPVRQPQLGGLQPGHGPGTFADSQAAAQHGRLVSVSPGSRRGSNFLVVQSRNSQPRLTVTLESHSSTRETDGWPGELSVNISISTRLPLHVRFRTPPQQPGIFFLLCIRGWAFRGRQHHYRRSTEGGLPG